LSALAIIQQAAECGIRLSLNGDNVAFKASTKPSSDMLAALKKHKAEIVALLRQEVRAVRPAGYSDLEWLAAIVDAKRLGYPLEGETNAPPTASIAVKKLQACYAPIEGSVMPMAQGHGSKRCLD
jgi:TubC N-terminal docking domain